MKLLMCASVGVLCLGAAALGGNLTPPAGPVAPTPGPEPRTAINATNTPGDADSVYKISSPGSYYLTGNVTGAASKNGIEITASGVTIDLMGFEVVGVEGSYNGIRATVVDLVSIEIRNGSVRSWSHNGISLSAFPATNCRVESIRASSNGGAGITVHTGSLVTNCVASQNTAFGIGAVAGSTIEACSSFANHSDGFNTNGSCVLLACTAYDNDGDGFYVSSSLVSRCVSANNLGDGIEARFNCTITGNSCTDNGNGAADAAGIHVVGGDSRIQDNNCTDSDRGIDVDGVGNIIIRNTCAGNTTNWDIVANNVCGPVIDRIAPASAAILGNAGASSLGSTDPNANYTY